MGTPPPRNNCITEIPGVGMIWAILGNIGVWGPGGSEKQPETFGFFEDGGVADTAKKKPRNLKKDMLCD